MIGLLFKFKHIYLRLQIFYLTFQLLVLLEHLTCSLLIVFDLVFKIEDLAANIFGPDQIWIHFNDALRLRLYLLYLRMRNLDDLLLVNSHPRLE